MAQGVFDRKLSTKRKSTAATEWRTIPPTINVRHKKRPPPLTLHPKRSSEQLVWSPGPLDTGTTASSFTSFGSSASSEPPSAFTSSYPFVTGQDTRMEQSKFYATPAFQQSPDVELHEPPIPFALLSSPASPTDAVLVPEAIAELETVNEEALDQNPPPPPEPLEPFKYLILHPWTFPEYLLLHNLVARCSYKWDDISSALNSASSGNRQHSPWDCWHRWTVPWCADAPPPPSDLPTFAHAPGMQHTYHFVDIASLIDIYALVSRAFAPSAPSPQPIPTLDVAPRGLPQHIRHSAYPPVASRPNVPARTYGHRHWGMSSWFHMSAVNVPALRQLLEEHLEPVPRPETRPLPRHLQGLKIPPPPRVVSPASGQVEA